MSQFANRHVVISGGGSGVGVEIATQFTKAGAKVSILGRRKDKLDGVASDIGALAIACDVTDSCLLYTSPSPRDS